MEGTWTTERWLMVDCPCHVSLRYFACLRKIGNICNYIYQARIQTSPLLISMDTIII